MFAKSDRSRLQSLVIISFLIALEIVLSRLLVISTPILRISLGFLPIAFIAIMYGPLWAAGSNAISDFLGVTMFPTGYPYFIGYTLSYFLTGATFGIFLHKRNVTVLRVLPASIIVCLLINLGLNTLWTSLQTGKGWMILLPPRLIKDVVFIPIQCTLIPLVWKYVKRFAPVEQT